MSRRTVVLAALAATLALVPPATAGVRAFDATTGAVTPGFTSLGSVGRPNAVADDGAHGVFVVGNLRVAGTRVAIAHVRADGSIDPAFHASVRANAVFSAAVRGHELALLGSFTRVDGVARRDVAVLDTRTGRLLAWAPRLPTSPRGQGFPHVLFAGARLVAASIGAVTAFRDGSSSPVWTDAFPVGDHADAVPEIAPLQRQVVAATAAGALVRIDPRSGTSRIAATDFRWSELQQVGDRLVFNAQGAFVAYGDPADRLCQPSEGTYPTNGNAIAGTNGKEFVAIGPDDADPPAPPTTIVACTRSGAPVPGFVSPQMPTSANVWDLALVGSHLVAFS